MKYIGRKEPETSRKKLDYYEQKYGITSFEFVRGFNKRKRDIRVNIEDTIQWVEEYKIWCITK